MAQEKEGDETVDVLEAIRARKSIRGFKPDPVSREILREILTAACRAPSPMNTQPWELLVLTGPVLDSLKKRSVEALRAGAAPAPEHLVVGWPVNSVYRNRQVDLAKQLLRLMGIQRDDKEKRTQWMERGFRYFDAPVVIILLVDRSLSEGGPLMDIGAVMQTICLAALPYGLGTCIEDQGVMYPKILREEARIHREKLRSRPFPMEWLEIVSSHVPYYRRLPEEDRRELLGHIQVFLDEKRFEGCGGLELTDEIRVTVAANACILLLHRKTDYYPRLKSIVVYPHTHTLCR